MGRGLKLLQRFGQVLKYFFQHLALTFKKGFVLFFLVGVSLSLILASCTANSGTGGGSAAAQQSVDLTLVGYAVPKAAHDAILPKFQQKWNREHGQHINFSQSYGASGAQTRAIIDGLDAHVIHLAVGSDVEKLVKEKLVSPDWKQRIPNNGIVSETVAVIITRKGNPKNIRTWADLTRNDVKWVTANPKTSGGAKWNFLALWNDAMQRGGDEAQAQEFVTKAFNNVAVLARDSREATDAFAEQGQGDALVNYENEVLLARAKGKELEYVVPSVNISIDTPGSVVDHNVDRSGNRAVATAFVEFLFTPEAQQEFVKVGFRPIGELAKNKAISAQFPPIKHLGTIDDYGGWSAVQKKFFDEGGIFDQVQASIKK